MLLYDLVSVLRRHKKIVFGTTIAFLALSFFGFFLQPDTVKASLLLTITRAGYTGQDAYRYDDFYRLQADERYSDTVVRLLGHPRIEKDIADAAKNHSFRSLKGRRLSSQVVSVTFHSGSAEDASAVARAVTDILERETERLNELQKHPDWFVVLGSEPVITKSAVPFSTIFPIALFLGLFVGFWAALFKHYSMRDGRRASLL